MIALTDLGGSVVQRNTYTPYGQMTVNAVTELGDYDGDNDVDNADEALISGACAGSNPTEDCRTLDLNSDLVVDATDDTLIDALKTDLARHPAKTASAVDFPFGPHGDYYDVELGGYYKRARHYIPHRGFMQRDPFGYIDGLNQREYLASNPTTMLDPTGTWIPGRPTGRWGRPWPISFWMTVIRGYHLFWGAILE
ncbi:unnamed protein product, partial [marine sediment metagenome]